MICGRKGRVMLKRFGEKTRRKMSGSAKRRCDARWRRQKSEAYATKLSLVRVKHLYYGEGKTQSEVAAALGTTQKVVWGFMRRNRLRSRVAAPRDQRGCKNNAWKSKAAGYAAYHKRVEVLRGKPMRCEW